MLRAILNDKDILSYDYDRDTLKTWAEKGILLCPQCGKPYEYCHGKVRLPYFRHKDKTECDNKYSEPETEEHIKGKADLYEWIKIQPGVTDAVLEGWIKSTHQKPDIMFKCNNEQYVIEYQCTPIASEYEERHQLYQVAGINDIWILGWRKFVYCRKYIQKKTDYYYDTYTECIKRQPNNSAFNGREDLSKCIFSNGEIIRR